MSMWHSDKIKINNKKIGVKKWKCVDAKQKTRTDKSFKKFWQQKESEGFSGNGSEDRGSFVLTWEKVANANKNIQQRSQVRNAGEREKCQRREWRMWPGIGFKAFGRRMERTSRPEESERGCLVEQGRSVGLWSEDEGNRVWWSLYSP